MKQHQLTVTHVLFILLGFLTVIDSNLVRAKSLEPVRFVEEVNWPPFTSAYEGITSEGLSYDLISEVFKQINTPVTLELYPMKRMLLLLKQGKRDGATVISKNTVRQKFISFSEPLFQKRGLIFYNKLKRPKFSWKSYSDLKGLSIGIVLGHNYGNEFLAAVKKFGLVTKTYRREHKLFQLLDAGRLDLVLSIEMVGRWMITQKGYGATVEAAKKPYFLEHYHIGVSQLSPLRDRLGEINKAIITLRNNGVLDNIVNRYLGSEK